MDLHRVLNEQRKLIRPSDEEIKKITGLAKSFSKEIASELKSKKIDADVFLGGSFAKGTMLKGNGYDVDVFIRFNPKYEDISKRLSPIIEKVSKALGWRFSVVHGSRDYFRVILPMGNLVFEILPVNRIKKPNEEKNVTDLSYFHVAYVKKNAKGIEDEIRLAKKFCRSTEVYGAESYVNGFSGYALECLIIKYRSFAKLIKVLSKLQNKEIIDPAGHYSDKHSALLSMNESKTLGPVVLVDPTFRERNVLAGLNEESFNVFKKSAKDFLAKPSDKFFEEPKFDLEKFKQSAKKRKDSVSCIALITDRQEGDIAGTKLKKCSNFIIKSLKRWMKISNSKFIYGGGKDATLYLSWKIKDFEIRKGPPIKMDEEIKNFKETHKNNFVKGNRVWAKVKISSSINEILEKILGSKEQIYRMGLVDYSIR